LRQRYWVLRGFHMLYALPRVREAHRF
jgi:hypothetical protein